MPNLPLVSKPAWGANNRIAFGALEPRTGGGFNSLGVAVTGTIPATGLITANPPTYNLISGANTNDRRSCLVVRRRLRSPSLVPRIPRWPPVLSGLMRRVTPPRNVRHEFQNRANLVARRKSDRLLAKRHAGPEQCESSLRKCQRPAGHRYRDEPLGRGWVPDLRFPPCGGNAIAQPSGGRCRPERNLD